MKLIPKPVVHTHVLGSCVWNDHPSLLHILVLVLVTGPLPLPSVLRPPLVHILRVWHHVRTIKLCQSHLKYQGMH
jgi:hypothetical protein